MTTVKIGPVELTAEDLLGAHDACRRIAQRTTRHTPWVREHRQEWNDRADRFLDAARHLERETGTLGGP